MATSSSPRAPAVVGAPAAPPPIDPEELTTGLARLAERTLEFDFTVWFWGDAIAIDGLLDAARALNHEAAFEHCRRACERWASRDLSWVDHLAPGVAILRIAETTSDHTLVDAARRLGEWLVDAVPKGTGGLPLYRPDVPEYRHTAWVDSLYHAPPFLAALGAVTGEATWFDAAVGVWLTHVDALTTESGNILCHAYDAGRRAQRGHAWGRGNGWAVLGAIDLLEILPKEHPEYERVHDWLASLVDELLALQDPSGFWHTLLDDRESYLESSTAAFFATALRKGIRLGLLEPACQPAAARATRATLGRVDGAGAFWGVSACTYVPIASDGERAMYRTLPTEVNVWGQGAALRCLAENLIDEQQTGDPDGTS